ncbi:MAG: cation diffusion facilitator family transporter [Actinobacteria bacterium]|jgi:cobalt-zinc-cadmium efflux system protein|nr:cation diffusion facilitator family transporter [Actinomycetota bacterium]
MTGHDHSHGPSISAGGMHRKRLLIVLGITSTVLVAELVGARLTGSLALLADAGHMFTDVAGILLAVLAVTFASRPPTPERTFGYYRLEILAAVINAMLLFGVAAYILWEAWQRWNAPPEVEGGLMLVFAAVGLVANIVGLLVLRDGAKESLNIRGAYLEVLGDMLGSVAVIVAAIVIATTGWLRADVVASVAVALMILPRTWTLLREAVDVLLQATPKNVDLGVVREHILGIPGVIGAHDLHAWTLTSGLPVLSVHVVVQDDALADGGAARILDDLADCLEEHFDVEHCTFQLEPASHAEHEFHTHA